MDKSRNLIFLSLALVIFIFNFSFKTNLNAVDSSIVISAQNLVKKHNEIRERNGLADLKLSSVLSNSATNKVNAMLANNCWAHYCPEGKSPWAFFDEAGYVYEFAGENLAEGFYNVNLLMETWMNSKTHKDNILNSNYDEMGVGIVSGNFQGNNSNIIVAVHFGKRSVVVNEPYINITSPKANEVINESSVRVEGNYYLVNNIIVNLDENLEKIGQVSGSTFSATFEDLEEGAYSVTASGTDRYGNKVNANNIDFSVEEVVVSQPLVTPSTDALSSGGGGLATISPEAKNAVNIGFLVFIAIIFLIDFIILSRTKMLKEKKSFPHFHFILFVITALALSIGSFGGNI
jgi:uncharacterized protein YkwD